MADTKCVNALQSKLQTNESEILKLKKIIRDLNYANFNDDKLINLIYKGCSNSKICENIKTMLYARFVENEWLKSENKDLEKKLKDLEIFCLTEKQIMN
ncbi:hypothetical protein A3Q56_07730, partial [Intoshia linei]